MANFWDNDPLLNQPAPRSNPSDQWWANDPVAASSPPAYSPSVLNKDPVSGLDSTASAYRFKSEQDWGGKPGVAEEFVGGAKHALDRAALGVKTLLPQSVQNAGDWIDRQFGVGGVNPELVQQGKAFVKQTGAGSTIGQGTGDLAITAPTMMVGGPLVNATRTARMLQGTRDIAANAGYAAATSPEDRGEAAAYGGAGATAGRVLNRVLGQPIRPSAEAEAYLAHGVPLTPGQAGEGAMGAIARTGESITKRVPLLDKAVRAAQARGEAPIPIPRPINAPPRQPAMPARPFTSPEENLTAPAVATALTTIGGILGFPVIKPVAAAMIASYLGTTSIGRKVLLGQYPAQRYLMEHPEVTSQIGRVLATQAGAN